MTERQKNAILMDLCGSCGKIGGAEGIRTLDLLDAIEARSQLRHGPTVGRKLLKDYSREWRLVHNAGRRWR
jgi:hypothetical protein